jgi:hypothetical protein
MKVAETLVGTGSGSGVVTLDVVASLHAASSPRAAKARQEVVFTGSPLSAFLVLPKHGQSLLRCGCRRGNNGFLTLIQE